MNEIAVAGITTGSAVVANIRRDTDEQIWRTDTLAFEEYDQTNFAAGKYDVALTEQGSSGYFVGDFPTDITDAGLYNISFFTLLVTTYTFQASGQINWNGSAESTSPAGLNWITRDQYKTFASITGTSQDALIDQLLPQASVFANLYTDRTIKQTNVVEVLRGNNIGCLKLSAYPVASVTAITFNYLGLVETAIDGSNFFVSPTGTVVFKPSSTNRGLGFNSFLIKSVYVGGYASVPQDLQLAVCLIVQRLMILADPNVLVTEKVVKDVKIKYDSALDISDVIPESAKTILDQYRQLVVL